MRYRIKATVIFEVEATDEGEATERAYDMLQNDMPYKEYSQFTVEEDD